MEDSQNPQSPEKSTPKIIHSSSGLGSGFGDTPAADQAETPKKNKIRTFEKTRQDKEWKRSPNSPGTGAVHVKTFHSKMTEDGLRFMDDSINEWLEEHPDFEVKFVCSTVGVFTGKIKEPHMVCQVWI